MKKIAQKKCRKMFLEAIFFAFKKNLFQRFCTKLLSLLYMRSLAYKISHYLSANHNREFRCVRVLMGVPRYQLTTNFSANCQLTAIFQPIVS